MDAWAAGQPLVLSDAGSPAAFVVDDVEHIPGAQGATAGVLLRKHNSQPSELSDPAPRPVFHVSLSAKAGIPLALATTNASRLFPNGPHDPVLPPLTMDTAARGDSLVFALAHNATLLPQQTVTFRFVYGYLPDDHTTAEDVLAAIPATQAQQNIYL